jgi:hypothetical protein
LAAAAIGVGADIATETNHISTGTRSDHVETADESTQCESIAGLDREIQYDLMGIDHSTQSILAETIECGVQSEVPATVDVDVQTSVEVAETKDVDVQATAAVPETKDVDIQATAAFAETKDIGVQCEMSDADAIVPLFNNDIDEEYFDTNSKPSSRSTTEIAPTFSTIKPASYRPAVTVGTADTHEADNDALNNVGSKDEKLFTKSETDVLIASAVALALANATASKKKQVEEEPMDDPKRHTCDMSLNDQNNNNKARAADSAVASHSSNSIDNDDDVDDDEPMTDADFGNVVVHVPTEQDTITSSLYQATRQQPDQQYKESHVSDPTVFDEVPAPTHPVLAHDYPHQEREITEADVPIRPANPPPTALLNKAGRSPAFTESRSMSPISAHSKGKQPYDPYSDLESQPSHENMHQQQIPHLDKRRSVSISSLSTNNTNEQLHSITSSQYDTSGVRSNSAATTTDPNMINLITQTMIGDFLWKYTRKAVGGGMSERRHQRYFWIHPFTRTLYWSTAAPGLDGGQAKAKTGKVFNKTVFI